MTEADRSEEERPRLQAVTGLAKIPGPPPRRAAPLEPPARPSERPVGAPVPATVPTPPVSRPRKASERIADTTVKAVALSLPLDVRERLRAAAQARPETTLAEIVLVAIENQQARLAELVAAERPQASVKSTLFPQPLRAVTTVAEVPRVTVTIRLATGNLDVIDRLAAQFEADHRSQLVTAALRADLV